MSANSTPAAIWRSRTGLATATIEFPREIVRPPVSNRKIGLDAIEYVTRALNDDLDREAEGRVLHRKGLATTTIVFLREAEPPMFNRRIEPDSIKTVTRAPMFNRRIGPDSIKTVTRALIADLDREAEDIGGNFYVVLDNLKSVPSEPVRIADLNLDFTPFQVKDMSRDEVRNILKELVDRLKALQRNERGAVSIRLPSRGPKNTHYVGQLKREVLGNIKFSRRYTMRRDVDEFKVEVVLDVLKVILEAIEGDYLVTKRAFKYIARVAKQSTTDTLIDDICCYVGCNRSGINVLAAQKGAIVGDLTYKVDGCKVHCLDTVAFGIGVPTMFNKISHIESNAKMILVIEKHTVFVKLAQLRFHELTCSILITGRGQPDMASRFFVQKLSYTLGLPVFGLMDGDYAGLQIYSVYKYGSSNLIFDNDRLVTPNMMLLGVLPSDVGRYELENYTEKIEPFELSKIRSFLNETVVRKDKQLSGELKLMKEKKVKIEIEALEAKGGSFLVEYLIEKICTRGWIQ